MKRNISFIILTWNSGRYLSKCFDSIVSKCSEEQINYEILVMDNASTDASQEVFDRYSAQLSDRLKVEYLDRNTGTTFPRNLGIKKSSGEYLCILDSDTELRHGSLSSILSTLKTDPRIGLIAPKLILPNNKIQNSVKRFPTFLQKLFKILQAVFKLKTSNPDFYTDFPFNQKSEVDTAISACWIFHRHLVEKVGYLDEKIFYSPEDLDFCIRVRKLGYKILYWPELTVLHNTQQISHNNPFSKVSLSHFAGLLYYFKKHGGWFSNRHLYRPNIPG
jgi:GT2 family glycosyltransferase